MVYYWVMTERGRPKSAEKRRRILDAARTLFLRQGIAATSMAGVAADAGVAKQTLYSHFADKDALLREVLNLVRGAHAPEVAGEPDGEAFTVLRDPDILTALAGFGTYLVGLIVDPELAALRRVVITERLEDPWRSDGPDVLRAALLRDLARRPELHVPDPERAADHLIALVAHRATLDGLYGRPPPADPAEHYGVIDACLMFLRAYRAGPG